MQLEAAVTVDAIAFAPRAYVPMLQRQRVRLLRRLGPLNISYAPCA